MMIPRSNLVAFRALLALAVIVFSYIFTFFVGVACAVLPIAALLNGFGGVIGFAVAILGLVMSGTILWSLVPRREEFKVSGIQIELTQHPRLKELIEGIAARLDERVPAAVYLIPDANAFVTDRGGTFSFKGTRAMGLGLPLLASMSVSEFRAVLAHEFAHFYSGDTRLGPKIFQTRAAMSRALKNLASGNDLIRFLTRFGAAALLYTIVVHGLIAYWKLFLRITQLVSRQQEYRSDELACYIAGSSAMAQGLERVTMIGAISQSFWGSVVNPTIVAGYRPPLADGLHRYCQAPAIQKLASDSLARLLKDSKTSAYDTHPPIKLRLERIHTINVEGEYASDASPAISLLNHVDALEKQLLEALLPAAKAGLQPLNWDSAAATVWLPVWRKFVAQHASLLASATVDSLPALVRDLAKIGGKIRDPPGTLLTPPRKDSSSDVAVMEPS